MAKPVLRLERVATRGAVQALARHWHRTQPTPNADPLMPNGVRVLHGSGDPVADVDGLLARLDKPPRKDACLAVEVLASASEDQFHPPGGTPYSRDPDRVEAWTQATLKHLRDEFGDRLAGAVLHLDEQTPHVQALVVPLETKMRKPAGRAKDRTPRETVGLNADGLMGDRTNLSAYQDRYEQAMTPLGVGPRTRKKSEAPPRSTVREWYGRQEQAVQSIEHDAQLAYVAATAAQGDRTTAAAERSAAAQDRAAAALAAANAAQAEHKALEAARLAQESARRRQEEERLAKEARGEAEKAAIRQKALTTTVEATLDGRITAAPQTPERGRHFVFGGVPSREEQIALVEEMRPAGARGWAWANRFFALQEQGRERIRRQTLEALARPRKAAADIANRLRKLSRVLTAAEQKEVARTLAGVEAIAPRMAEEIQRARLNQDLVR